VLLNRFERALMNNPVRAAVQRRFEARRMEELGGALPGPRVLEIGCGRGVGIDILFDRFGAQSVDAFDLDPEMVELARQRHCGRSSSVRVWTGDATAIDAADDTYDAVFDFGIIHHIPAWRAALREVHRVLRPGGRFYAEEVLVAFIEHPVARRLFDHPTTDRFDRQQFALAVEEAGLSLVESRAMGTWFAWFVGEKPPVQVRAHD